MRQDHQRALGTRLYLLLVSFLDFIFEIVYFTEFNSAFPGYYSSHSFMKFYLYLILFKCIVIPVYLGLLVVSFGLERTVSAAESNFTLTGFRSDKRYWTDLCYAVLAWFQLISGLLVIFYPVWQPGLWLEFLPQYWWAAFFPSLTLFAFLNLHLRLYRIGYFRVHPIRRRAVALLRGKERCPDVLTAIIHNETDHYFSSFSMIPTRSKHMDLCAYDWERDVQAYQHLTLEGQALLLEQVQLVIYAVTATTPEEARERLKNIVALAYRRGELRPQVRLMVILVSDTPYSVEIPQDFYISQLDPKIVRQPEDISLEELAVQRYRSVRQRNSGSHAQPQTDLQALIRMDQNLSIRDLCLSANSIYSQSPYLLMNFLAQQEWEVERWDPLLVEFFRGSVQMTSCLSSLIALMNLIDMFLRLALYTLLMSRDEHPSPNKRNVPDNYSELGTSIFHAVRENDAVYYGVREQTEPCRLPAVLWGIGELLQADLRGDSFSCTGLCSALSYMRNKTKGHGVIREENAGLLWAFVLESVFTLGRMLCLDRFSIRREPDQVLAGWDGRLVNLGEFAIPAGNHPILMFDSKKEKQPVLIDYFHGSLVVPAIGQGPEVVIRISEDVVVSGGEHTDRQT